MQLQCVKMEAITGQISRTFAFLPIRNYAKSGKHFVEGRKKSLRRLQILGYVRNISVEKTLKGRFPDYHLQGLTFADSYPRGSVQVDVLIGTDHYYSFVTAVCKRGSSSESLVAVESCVGWIVTGQVNRQSRHTSSMLTIVENSGVNETLKRFWELE